MVIKVAMTINKCQGQTLKHVGVYLPTPIFLYSQLYVAISRVTSRKCLKIFITNEDGEDDTITSNVVCKKFLEMCNNLYLLLDFKCFCSFCFSPTISSIWTTTLIFHE